MSELECLVVYVAKCLGECLAATSNGVSGFECWTGGPGGGWFPRV